MSISVDITFSKVTGQSTCNIGKLFHSPLFFSYYIDKCKEHVELYLLDIVLDIVLYVPYILVYSRIFMFLNIPIFS